MLILAYVACVAYPTINPEWELPQRDATAVAGDLLTGTTAAIFGVQDAVRALFLSAFNLRKAVVKRIPQDRFRTVIAVALAAITIFYLVAGEQA